MIQARATGPFSRKRQLALAIVAALGLAAGSAFADGAETRALKDRVEQLEAMVQMLLDGRDQNVREIRRVEVEAERKMDELVNEKVAAALAEEDDDGGPSSTYKFGGYVKSDFIFSDYSDGVLGPGTIGRDFYVPGTIPVGGDSEGTTLDFHARESRFNLRSDHVLENGMEIDTFIELDFLVTAGGNERVSNSFVPRLRHAFVRIDSWLVGQTWSTFQNVGALPDNLDFVGPAEGTVFERQPIIRYTQGPWQFAIENPETTVTPFGGGARIVTDDGAVPDFVARYTAAGDWGNFVAAGIARRLAFENGAAGIDATEASYGLSLSGKLNVGDRDDFRWMFTAGSGLGRYIGLNVKNGAVLDGQGGLEGIDSIGGFASYRHFWTPRWRSNLTLSFLSADNDIALTGPNVTKGVESLHANVIYNPLPKFDFGVEFIYANRELESGDDGSLTRMQFSAKYAF